MMCVLSQIVEAVVEFNYKENNMLETILKEIEFQQQLDEVWFSQQEHDYF